MNTLDAYKINPHSIYGDGLSQITCSLNLIEFGKFQFYSSFVIGNLNKLKIICQTCGPKNPPSEEQIKDFLLNGLIDSIKISICFENFGKSILLAKGFLVHQIDRNLFPDLAKQQKDRPILIEDLPGEWTENNKIKTTISSPKKVKNGLLMNTINYSTMLNSDTYVKECLYDERCLSILKEINSTRNQLHLHNALSFSLKDDSYSRYYQLNDFVKTSFEKIKIQLSAYLGPDNLSPTPEFVVKLKAPNNV